MKRLTVLLALSIFVFACTNRTETELQNKLSGQIRSLSDSTTSRQQKILVSREMASFATKFNLVDSTKLIIARQIAPYNSDDAIRILKKVSSSSTSRPVIVQAYHLLGNIYREQDSAVASFQHFYKATTTVMPEDNTLMKAQLYIDMSYLLLEIKDFVESEKYARKALQLSEDPSFNIIKFDGFCILSQNASALNNFDQALSFAERANDIYKADNSHFEKIHHQKVNELIADIYYDSSKFDLAAKFYDIALQSATKNDDQQRLILQIAESKLKSARQSEFHNFLATQSFLKDSVITKHDLKADLLYAAYYFTNKQNDRARSIAESVYKKNQSIDDLSIKLTALSYLVKLNHPDSKQFALKVIHISDSIQTRERQIQNVCARTVFNTEILAQEKAEADERTRAIAETSAFTLAFIILILMIIRQTYQHWQVIASKNKSEANNQVYKIFTEQKQIHDQKRSVEQQRIAFNLSSGIINKLRKTQKDLLIIERKTDDEAIDKFQHYIDDLQSIERDVRDIAHDINHEIFSGNSGFNVILNNLFNSMDLRKTKIYPEIEEIVNWDLVPNAIKMNLYIILEKLLINLIKFSVSKNIFVNFTKSDNILQMIIIDDGKGYSHKLFHGRFRTNNIYERVKSLNGNIDIHVRVGKGTTIIVNLPTIAT